jgi:sugar O-acyltransferase (sialic acid O-acetyltransferase NeuD family)
MTAPVVIYGTGGHARELHQTLEDVNAEAPTFEFLGWLDDSVPAGLDVHGVPVLGGEEWIAAHPDVAVLFGIGSPASRRRLVERSVELGARAFPSVVHPSAWVGNRVEIGEGSVICAGARVTTDIVIGRHVHLNTGSIVSHDCRLDDFVTVAPGARVSGAVEVGEGADVGTGSTTIQGRRIGRWSIVGAGAVVVDDVPDDATVVGVPARTIAERVPGWHEAVRL